jgi:hypothetical protein
MHKLKILVAAMVLWPTAALSDPPPEIASMPVAKHRVGSASVRILFWSIFDATLWSESKEFDWSKSFALTLTYTKEFSAKSLAKTTTKEMARLGSEPTGLLEFRETFRQCLDDVVPGDRITAVNIADDEVLFFQNGTKRCTLKRPGLKKDFFGIWLDENSKFPSATAELLGRQKNTTHK